MHRPAAFTTRDRILAAIAAIGAAFPDNIGMRKAGYEKIELYVSRGKGRGTPSRNFGSKAGKYMPHDDGGGLSLFKERFKRLLRSSPSKEDSQFSLKAERLATQVQRFYSRNPRPWRTDAQLSQTTRERNRKNAERESRKSGAQRSSGEVPIEAL